MSEPTATRAPEPDGPTVTSGGIAASPPPQDDALAAPPGYELRSLIGSGGMGVVYRAYDLSLSRHVAIKFLHVRYGPESVTSWRFTEEARITARLQHPGIPPVHQVGKTPDGRPFLAMKLIKGETLEELLKARKFPADDRGRFVGIFEQVAQAIAFAHSRRIIHRDLKPANVMVGDFGEVQVMDWGLAKELSDSTNTEPTNRDETLSVELQANRDGGDATQAGSLLGTPAYMPPEQAVGAIDQINERSDVFGLGAILCVILTGQPPFVADGSESTRILAARGKLDDAFTRLDACGAEPELVALAKRCLAPEAADRPADAEEVATALAAFRTDAERRARQAEMDRATAEVKAAEERKRRRVQRVLALTFLGLVAVAGGAAWWVDRERKARQAELEADAIRKEAAQRQQEAVTRTRQLTTERDVSAALNEVQVLRERGWKEADDTHRWGLTLAAARSSLKRAEGLLTAGEPTDELRSRVATATSALAQDERDRALITELDRITEENDVRYLIPIPLSRRPSDQYAAAFRAHGIDLVVAPHAEAVEWLKNHRFRARLTAVVRNWHLALPTFDPETLFGGSTKQSPSGPNTQPGAPGPVLGIMGGQMALAVGSQAALAAIEHRTTLRERLKTLADDLTDDPFAREWWAAVNVKDRAALKRLLARPELRRASSAELSTFADGLVEFPGVNDSPLTELLHIAYERFPGDYWVNFRLAERSETGQARPNPSEKDLAERRLNTLRYLGAAVAAKPRSAIARIALGATYWEHRRGDPTALNIARAAIDLDPTSPWPHLFLGFMALENGDFTGVRESFVGAVRADPDTSYLMVSSMIPVSEFTGRSGPTPGMDELARIIEALIAASPKHPGGYELRANMRQHQDDYRGALADFRTAKGLARADYLRTSIANMQIGTLEQMALWEGKLPAVLRGELKPTPEEYAELAEYCAGFERKYALAARFGGEALTGPVTQSFSRASKFAGWAVHASRGLGADAASLSATERTGLRRQALAWLRDARRQEDPGVRGLAGYEVWMNPKLAPVREPEELAKLPPEERIAWEKFWRDVPNPLPRQPEPAPPPREVKR